MEMLSGHKAYYLMTKLHSITYDISEQENTTIVFITLDCFRNKTESVMTFEAIALELNHLLIARYFFFHCFTILTF